MGLIDNFIANKIYSALYLDFLLKFIWERVVEIWHIGGSAIHGAIGLLLLMLIIVIIPLIPFIALVYGIYKLLKYYKVI